MRLWSLHPKYLDAKGLVALWREGLLAQKVLNGKTKGYRHHPQLERFKETPDSLKAIGSYLREVYFEAERRGYSFDKTKILFFRKFSQRISVHSEQLDFEFAHLKRKCRQRSRKDLKKLLKVLKLCTHPIFKVVKGKIHSWERGS